MNVNIIIQDEIFDVSVFCPTCNREWIIDIPDIILCSCGTEINVVNNSKDI